jgi:DNA-binding HxlR family transcriptional regulator
MTTIECGCHVDRLFKLMARAWTPHIAWLLGRNGEVRFGQLRRALPGTVSAKVLAARLRELERLGLVERRDKGGALRQVSYQLTESGRELDRIICVIEREARDLQIPDIEDGAVDGDR